MRTVALVDFHTEGHHYAFLKLFAKYVLRNGWAICIIYPERKEEIRNFLIGEGFCVDYIFFYEATIVKQRVSGFGRFNNAIETFRYWVATRRLLREVERNSKISIDLVFFAWLDDHLSNYLPAALIDFVFPYLWSGLYFHPWYLYRDVGKRVSFSSIDSVLTASGCVGVSIHDEFLQEKLAFRINKPVFVFPEIADSTAPDRNCDLARRVKEAAAGRMIIGLIGSDKRKGVLYFKELARHADRNLFFFFLSGKVPAPAFTQQELEGLNDFLNSEQENLFYYPGYIEEGAMINAVIDSFDFLFLVYDDFKSSSNFNTKGAIFRKLVLATDRYWIGNVTRKYSLGVTVPEGDTRAMINGLEALGSGKVSKAGARFDEYLKVHDEENLFVSFNQVLELTRIN